MSLNRGIKRPYYSVLGVKSDASSSAIRDAYRKLAMKWHPDKYCSDGPVREEQAKLMFQEIQEAYSVLSDKEKRAFYDIGLYNPEDDGEETKGLSSFIGEMSALMAQVKVEIEQITSFQDLQQLFVDMFSADLSIWGLSSSLDEFSSGQYQKKRSWRGHQSEYHCRV